MGRTIRPLEVMAIATMFAMTLTMYLVWAIAYVNGGSVTLFIDRFGERYFELLLWTFVVPLVALGLYSYARRHRGDDVENRTGPSPWEPDE